MKTCTKCGKSDGEVEFGSYKRGARMQTRPACKGCCRESSRAYDASRRDAKRAYNKAYYRANPAYFQKYNEQSKAARTSTIVAAHKKARHERYAKIRALKEASPCTDCRRSFPYCVMDFDHRDPSQKVADVSTLVKVLVPWERVEAEIIKCELVCACCHRLRTYKGQHVHKTRQYNYHRTVLDELKATTPCSDCGGSFQPCQMDFDHASGAKLATVAELMDGTTDALRTEIGKCHLVCANCHRIRTMTGIRCQGGSGLVEKLDQAFARAPYPEDRRRRRVDIQMEMQQ